MTRARTLAAAGEDPLATTLRNLYVFHRRAMEARCTGRPSDIGARPIPSWDGGVDRNGRRFSPVWPRVAAWATSRAVKPVVLMESLFHERAERAPEPNQLMSDGAERKYREYLRSAVHNASVHLKVQSDQFGREVGRLQRLGIAPEVNRAARAVLVDPSAQISALFRHCVADRAGATDLAAATRDAALMQLTLGYYGYSDGWRGFIPGGLELEALGNLRLLCRDGGGGDDAHDE